MKHNIPLNILPITAVMAVAARLAVKVVAGGCAPANSGDAVIGYSGPYDVPAGGVVDVVTAGVIPVQFSTAVVAGDKVGVDSAGKLKAVTADQIGVAAEDCAAGDVGSLYRI